MPEIRRDVGQGHQREAALGQEGVRKFQVGKINDFVSEKQQVDVDEPRAPLFAAHPAQAFFDGLGGFEQSKRRERGVNFHGLVEKRGLVGEAPGGGFVQRGGFQNRPYPFPEKFNGPAERGGAVAEVGTEEQKNGKHEAKVGAVGGAKKPCRVYVCAMKKILVLLLGLAMAAHAQNKWEPTIQNFEKQDRQTPPPKAPIVFVGSSSFAFWTDVQRYFPKKTILNRGFGGSELSDVLHYADRVILAYKPSQVVIYAGENDLAAGGKTPADVYGLFTQLFAKLRQAQPDVPIVFVSLKPSPSRWKLKAQQDETNRLIQEYLARQRHARFVNVVPVMLDPGTSRPKSQLFKPDSLHMTADGYQLWAELLRPVLK